MPINKKLVAIQNSKSAEHFIIYSWFHKHRYKNVPFLQLVVVVQYNAFGLIL